MLSFNDKIEALKSYLSDVKDNYADSFKEDICLHFNHFEDVQDQDFEFLEQLNTIEEIHTWVDNLTSRIVMKFDEEHEQLSDFIFYERY